MKPVSALALVAAVAAVLGACHGSYHAFDVADRCGCGVREYCDIKPASSSAGSRTQCLPLPASCPDPPTCQCLGRREDACREELGRFWVFEPRDVDGCGDCTSEEYCTTGRPGSGGSSAHRCRLLPPQCEDQPTCACVLHPGRMVCSSCNGHDGRIEVVSDGICSM